MNDTYPREAPASQELFDRAFKAFGRRVSASGMIRYNRESHPTSINVEELRVLGEEEDLPSAADVAGILTFE